MDGMLEISDCQSGISLLSTLPGADLASSLLWIKAPLSDGN
jgi:hypothetical protein